MVFSIEIFREKRSSEFNRFEYTLVSSSEETRSAKLRAIHEKYVQIKVHF